MNHIFFILIGCALIVLTRRIYYRNFELFLCCLIIVNFDFFHLIPRIGEFDLFKESLLIVILFYLFEEYIGSDFIHREGRSPTPPHGSYRKLIGYYIIMLIWGVLVAYYHGQDLVFGIKAFKYYPIILTYFLIIKKGLNIEKFTYFFTWLAVVIATLTFFQYLTFDKLHFFFFYEDSISHVRGLSSDRGLRILEGNTVIIIGSVIAFVKWLKTCRKLFLFMTIFLFAHVFVVIQTRMALAAIILVMLLTSFLLNRYKTGREIKALYLAGCGLFVVVLFVSFFQNIFSSHGLVAQTMSDIQQLSTGRGTGNLEIRLLAYQHYWNELKTYWFAGRGLLNNTWSGNPDSFLQEIFNFHLSDIGVFHIIVNFGLAGLILLAFLLITILKSLGKLVDAAPEVACYFLLGLIMLPQIDLFFRVDNIFLFALFTACSDLALTSKTGKSENRVSANSAFQAPPV